MRVAVSRHGNNGPVALWMLSRHVTDAEVGRGAEDMSLRGCALELELERRE